MSVHVAAVAEAVHVKQHLHVYRTVYATQPTHTRVSSLIFFDLGAISLDFPRPLFPWKIHLSGHLKQALWRDERHLSDRRATMARRLSRAQCASSALTAADTAVTNNTGAQAL